MASFENMLNFVLFNCILTSFLASTCCLIWVPVKRSDPPLTNVVLWVKVSLIHKNHKPTSGANALDVPVMACVSPKGPLL